MKYTKTDNKLENLIFLIRKYLKENDIKSDINLNLDNNTITINFKLNNPDNKANESN